MAMRVCLKASRAVPIEKHEGDAALSRFLSIFGAATPLPKLRALAAAAVPFDGSNVEAISRAGSSRVSISFAV